jgi:hypothetical protein
MDYNILGAIIMLIVLIIPVIIIYSLTLQWIDKLEKTNCSCSEDSLRDFIKYYLYVYLILLGITFIIVFISVFVEFSSMKLFKVFTPFISLIRTLMAILSIVNIIVSIIYISKLKEIDCKCSEDIRREIYYIWSLISIVINAVIFLFMIIAAIWIYFMFYKSK